MADAIYAQNLMLSILGVPYRLGAEITPSKIDPEKAIPGETDCSESLQFIMSLLGHNEFGDGAWLQWQKCRRWVGKDSRWPFAGIGVLFNNPARSNRVGHIFINAGVTRFGTQYVFESRGNAYGGSRLTRLTDMRTHRGPSALGYYAPLEIDGQPDTLFAWRGYRGAATVRVQRALRAHGITDDKGREILVDSDFGERTQQAVREFQRKNNMFASGAVTGKVWEAMK